MSYKENNDTGATSSIPTPFIKPEPQETRLAPLTESTLRRNASDASDALTKVKAEPKDAARVFVDRGLPVPAYAANSVPSTSSAVNASSYATAGTAVPKTENVAMGDVVNHPPTALEETKPRLYTIYDSATDVPYQPEDALKEGLAMVKTLKANIKTLELGSKLRQDVWLREIDSLQTQGAPTTMIAVCGATGAGKSSILNAILDDNIVPTSGMRACTAVVTEIAYHTKKTIDADVSFLSEKEWKEELEVLLDDLVDEDGNFKRSTDMRSDAGVAWSKVHAVYPTLSQEQLVGMTADQIVAKDQKIARILGTTKNIIAKDSKIFAQEIAKYIDSKDQKRGKKDKKEKKEKSKPKETSFAEMFSKEKQTAAQRKDKEQKDDGPALWPLIRQVNVRCPSAVLSTGAILVDLPGVADANAARNSIAKDYMKKCDCVWILAAVTRAVDDKTARDLLGDAFKMQLMNGNYDAHAITFIASKTDDISCSEVIRALQLEEEPELEEIEERIEQYKDQTSEWKQKKTVAEKSAKAIDTQLKEVRAYLKEYKAHLGALENSETFKPTLTSKGTEKESKKVNGKKRKRNGKGGQKDSPKRRKSDAFEDDEDEDMLGSDDDDMEGDIESDVNRDDDSDSDETSEDEESDDDDASQPGSDSDDGSDKETDDEETVESLQTKIADANNAIKAGRERLSEVRGEKKDAIDGLAGLKKKQAKVQKEKNAFCSLKRSEFSRDVLKEDFRVGLKDLDDAAAEERDPDSFNPNLNLRNYDEIDLPVFTCSARDYVRLQGQLKGDGEASCFSNLDDTGVPALQEWCHQLTVSSRERAARNFLSRLKTFANSVRAYVQGIGDVTAADRTLLREKWESSPQEDEDEMDPGYGGWAGSDPFDLPGFPNLAGGLGDDLYSMNKAAPKVDQYGEPVGVTPILAKGFKKVTDDSVRDLQRSFRDGLEEKCRVGAANAAEAAVPTTDAFAASMHWGTFRATLRRHGEFRRSLNVELVNPFTRNIASSWQQVFEGDLFISFEAAALKSINKLLKDVEDSAALGLKDRVKSQAELCLEETKVALKKTLELVRQTMNNEQKEVSRCLAPHVQDQLVDGYDRAMEERGTGSVARQKAIFHNYIDGCKDDVFDDGADVLLGRLEKAAEAIGATLDTALFELAEKIEVNLSVLWEGPRDNPDQVRARKETVGRVTEILCQVQLWTEAEQLRMKD